MQGVQTLKIKVINKEGKLSLGRQYAGKIYVVQARNSFTFDLICLDEPDAERGPVRKVNPNGMIHLDAMFRGQLFSFDRISDNQFRIEMLIPRRSSEDLEAAHAVIGTVYFRKSKLFPDRLVYETKST